MRSQTRAADADAIVKGVAPLCMCDERTREARWVVISKSCCSFRQVRWIKGGTRMAALGSQVICVTSIRSVLAASILAAITCPRSTSLYITRHQFSSILHVVPSSVVQGGCIMGPDAPLTVARNDWTASRLSARRHRSTWILRTRCSLPRT